MKARFALNKEKMIHSMLFVVNDLGGQTDLHKLFKILYFADQKHLILYGFPITGDVYNALTYGPVPSSAYEYLKAIRGDGFFKTDNKLFEVVDNYVIIAKTQADLDELAESDIECLTEAIQDNKVLNFNELTTKSHQMAWNLAQEDPFNEMSIEHIAKEANVHEEILKYIFLNIENQNIIYQYAKIR